MDRIIRAAPGRTGIVGNPSDIYGGSVVSSTIPQRAEVTLTPQPMMEVSIGGDHVLVEPDMDPRCGIAGKWTDIGLAALAFFCTEISPKADRPVCRLFSREDPEAVRALCRERPFRIEATSTIPYRAGLSGSTALMGALIGAILEHLGLHLHHHQFAETVKYVEQNILGVSCGFQDHYMITFGGVRFLDFRGKSSMRQQEDEPFATVEDLSWTMERMPFVVAHCGGIRQETGIVHVSIRQRWEHGEEKVVRYNERIGELGRLGKKALIGGDLEHLAELMNENHRLQQEIGGSFEQIDHFIEAARRWGAPAAKLAGGGCGGTLIALHDDREGLAAALKDLGAQFVTFPEPVLGAAL